MVAVLSVLENVNLPTIYPSLHELTTLGTVAATSITALKDIDNIPQDFTIGATSNVRVEAVENIQMFMGGTGDFELYTTAYDAQSQTRTDEKVFGIRGENTQTIFNFGNNEAVFVAGDANNTFRFNDLAIFDSNQYKTIDTGAMNGLRFLDNVTFEKGVRFNGDLITPSNVFARGSLVGSDLALFKDYSLEGIAENDPVRVGYAFRINEYSQLELIKYTRFLNGLPDATKKVGVFGMNSLLPTDSNNITSLDVFNKLSKTSFDVTKPADVLFVGTAANPVNGGSVVIDLSQYTNAVIELSDQSSPLSISFLPTTLTTADIAKKGTITIIERSSTGRVINYDNRVIFTTVSADGSSTTTPPSGGGYSIDTLTYAVINITTISATYENLSIVPPISYQFVPYIVTGDTTTDYLYYVLAMPSPQVGANKALSLIARYPSGYATANYYKNLFYISPNIATLSDGTVLDNNYLAAHVSINNVGTIEDVKKIKYQGASLPFYLHGDSCLNGNVYNVYLHNDQWNKTGASYTTSFEIYDKNNTLLYDFVASVPVIQNAGNVTSVTYKMNSSMNVLWSMVSYRGELRGVAGCSDGGALVGGIIIDTSGPTVISSSAPGSTPYSFTSTLKYVDNFVPFNRYRKPLVKISSSGVVQWHVFLEANYNEKFYVARGTLSGDVYLFDGRQYDGAYLTKDVIVDSTGASYDLELKLDEISYSWQYNATLVRFDSSGIFQWTSDIVSTRNGVYPRGMIVLNNGYIISIGQWYYDKNFDLRFYNSNGSLATSFFAPNSLTFDAISMVISCYDSSGNFMWYKNIPGTEIFDYNFSRDFVTPTYDGGFVSVLQTTQGWTFNAGWKNIWIPVVLTNADNDPTTAISLTVNSWGYIIFKYNSMGNLVWYVKIDGSYTEAHSIAELDDNGFLIQGFQSQDNASGTITITDAANNIQTISSKLYSFKLSKDGLLNVI